jgi:hypothetical protein
MKSIESCTLRIDENKVKSENFVKDPVTQFFHGFIS